MEHTCRLGSSFAEAASNAVDEPNRRKDRIGWENLPGASPKQRGIYIGTSELNGMCERGAGIAAEKGGGWGGLAHERSRGYKRAWVNKRGQERKAKYLEGQVWVVRKAQVPLARVCHETRTHQDLLREPNKGRRRRRPLVHLEPVQDARKVGHAVGNGVCVVRGAVPQDAEREMLVVHTRNRNRQFL